MSIVKVILRKMLSSVELWRCRAWHTQLSSGQDKDIYNFRSLKVAMYIPKSYSRVSMEELCKARGIYTGWMQVCINQCSCVRGKRMKVQQSNRKDSAKINYDRRVQSPSYIKLRAKTTQKELLHHRLRKSLNNKHKIRTPWSLLLE